MKSPSNSSGDHRKERTVPDAGRPESPASRETFPEREKRPGEVGLANEPRPGLGSRTEDAGIRNDDTPGARPADPKADDKNKPRATRYSYEEPRPAPREQASDSWDHEQERSTGASGNSGGV